MIGTKHVLEILLSIHHTLNHLFLSLSCYNREISYFLLKASSPLVPIIFLQFKFLTPSALLFPLHIFIQQTYIIDYIEYKKVFDLMEAVGRNPCFISRVSLNRILVRYDSHIKK